MGLNGPEVMEAAAEALDVYLAFLQAGAQGDLEKVKTTLAALGEPAYDVVWLAGLQCDTPEFKQAYTASITTLCAAGVLKQSLCVEQLDDDVLSNCHIIDNKDLFEKKIRRVKTKVL